MVPHHWRVRIPDFALERFFARWEFAVEHLLCASDVQAYPMAELLALADGETRALWDGLELGYTESTGHPLLRREIAALYETIEPDDVLTFVGAEEAIFCLANVLLGPGDHAIVTWPAYQSLYEVGRAAGADVTLHELHESDGWAIDIDRLRAQVTPATRLIVVNTPHNPTGMLIDRPTYEALVAIAAESGAHLLVDEVYRGLEFDESDRLQAGADALDRGISLGVMSKAYAMAGLRVGWLATHDRELLGRLAAFKDYTTICSSAPSEILSIIALACRPPGPCPVARDRRREPRPARRLPRRLGRPLHVGPATRRVDRVRAADGPRRPHRRLGRRARPGGRRAPDPRLAVRVSGQSLPARFRPDRPAPGARAPRGLRGKDAPMTLPARLSIVTLGVADLARSIAFYEALGWPRKSSSIEGSIAWFGTADSTIGLFPWDELAHDASLPPEPRAPFGGITLAINVESPDAVTAGLDAAVAAGGTILKPATLADWGGTSGYFADPDGHPWEVAHNPGFPIDADGRARIP